MSKEPTRVELFENGRRTLTLTSSDNGSLNGRGSYTGRATSARIHGAKGSIVTFYDDQRFRTGENHVVIEKLVDDPIEVFIGRNFVDRTAEAGDGVYAGETPTYKWALYKRVKKDWFARNNPFDLDKLREDPKGGTLVKLLGAAGVGKTTSNNYRVDNTSSVRFGA